MKQIKIILQKRNKKNILLLLFLCCCAGTFAQNTIRGHIEDENQEPMIGVSVVVKGTSRGAMTDISGNFSITASENDVLRFTSVGYKTQEIQVKGNAFINVTLVEDSELLDEVVVVGYGTQRKASLTSAISQIRGEETFKERGISNPSVALQGEVPGLTVTRTSTRPGSEGVSMKIRGDISLNGDNAPLVIIDGVAGSLDEFNQMDGNDIETISVLKDASAAIYGARSANGVVLVTTKRGKKGKPKISYNGSYSTTITGIEAPLTTIPEWLDMFYEAQYQDAKANNPGITDPLEIEQRIDWWIFGSAPLAGELYSGQDLFNALRAGETFTQRQQGGSWLARYEPTNLMDYLYGSANSQKHSVSVSGADEKFSYMASLGFADNNSQLKVAEDGEKKYSGRLNMDYQATDRLKVETGMSYEVRNITTPSTDVGAGYYDPWFWPVYNEAGQFYDTFSGLRNPVGGLVGGGQNKTKYNTFRGNIKAVYDFSFLLPGLSASATGAYKEVGKTYQELKKNITYYDWEGTVTGLRTNGGAAGGSLKEQTLTWKSVTFGGFLDYAKTVKELHNFTAMVGMTAEQEAYKNVTAVNANGLTYADADLTDLSVMNIEGEQRTVTGGQTDWSLVSFVTRLKYNYGDKYLLELLGRRDGSSRLVPEQRWKNFYAVSGGWVISEEDFMRQFNWLSSLKIRYNYGKTGSVTGIDSYEPYELISLGSTLFGDALQQTMWVSSMTSKDRTWETVHSHNAGTDFSFLRGRLSGSFDYFIKRNNGMFIDVTYPSILGASAPKTNNGGFQSKGWEFALSWRDKIGKVKYNIGGSVSDAQIKLLRIDNDQTVPNPGADNDRLIGYSPTSIFVFKTDGIFQTQTEVDDYLEQYYWNEDHTGPKTGTLVPAPATSGTNRLRPGMRKIVDLNGDGLITNEDIYYAGDKTPHFTFGIKAGLEWNGFDMQAFFQGVGQQTVLRSGYMAYPWASNYMLQNSTFLGQTWSEENTNTIYTVATRDNATRAWNYINKDVLVQNSSYIRLKSLIIGYTIPQKITQKASIDKVRVYFSGDDLWEWTKIKDGYDPEYGENSNNTFPFSRLLSFGLDIVF